MSITSAFSDDRRTVTIKVVGRFDFAAHQDFRRAFKEYPKGEKRFIVDLATTEYLDSSAMGMLLQLREHASGQTVELVNGNEAINEILRIASFDKLFRIA
jgi:anti-anti-sigma factor